jgi:hypothetical protein
MEKTVSQTSSSINAELKSLYEKETVIELSNRSKGTTAAYILDYVILVLLSPIYSKAPKATIAVGILFLVMIIIKIYSAIKTPVKYGTGFFCSRFIWGQLQFQYLLCFHSLFSD